MKKSKIKMKNRFYKEQFFVNLLIIGVLFLPYSVPYSVLASTVYIDTNHSEFFEGDTILFSARVDSEGKNINAVEGEVLLDHEAGAASLTDITTSGAVFSLWPGKPVSSPRNTRISFAGGSPGGFQSGDAIIFNIVLKLEKSGLVALSPNNIGVYLNDGKGTRDAVSVKELLINVLPKEPDAEVVDDWSTIISNDKTPPEPFEIYAGQDDTVFEGKKFLSFVTTDEGSGISYYEVTEGDLPPTQRDGTYVLQNQDKPTRVIVTAYDVAGNAQESVYDPKYSYLNLIFIVIVVLVLLLLVAFRFIAKKRKGN